MSRIALAWELGGGYGHLGALLPLAAALRRRGHDVVAVIKDVAESERWFAPLGIPVLQAPMWLPGMLGLAPAASYAELLFRFGYLEADKLAAMVKAWRATLDLLRPDLVVGDHCPTAFLAARAAKLPRVLLGTGFTIPPALSPLPSMVPWERVPAARLEQSERRVLETVNRVLETLATAPIPALHHLFDADETFLRTVQELDHYPGRGAVRYWGAWTEAPHGADARWPAGRGARVFAYVKPGFRGIGTLLGALPSLPQRFLVHVPGLSPDLARRHTAANVEFSSEPVHMGQVGEQADLVLSHGGANTAFATLSAARPMLLAPMQHEQLMLARRLAEQGLARTLDADVQPARIRMELERALSRPEHARAAEDFAAKYAGLDQAELLEEMAGRCEALAG